jgi:hypothetical protein
MNWEYKVAFICMIVSIFCKLGVAILKSFEQKEQPEKQIQKNRSQRRHPNGMTPVQKFKTVNVTGRQKQGNGRAVRGW